MPHRLPHPILRQTHTIIKEYFCLMAHSSVVISAAARSRQSAERAHRIRVWIAGMAALFFCVAMGVYGFDYYRLPRELRPFSDKHELLRPSGRIGVNLGILGTALFLIIFLYAFRKLIPALGRFGTAKHWMDFHIICGVSAPIIIAYHASFKFNNIAGVAFWIMLAVAISGIAGRYLYAQIPQSLNAAKTSYQELQANEEELAEALKGAIAFFRREDCAHLCHARGGQSSPELDAGCAGGNDSARYPASIPNCGYATPGIDSDSVHLLHGRPVLDRQPED